jgi:hypothetical protein
MPLLPLLPPAVTGSCRPLKTSGAVILGRAPTGHPSLELDGESGDHSCFQYETGRVPACFYNANQVGPPLHWPRARRLGRNSAVVPDFHGLSESVHNRPARCEPLFPTGAGDAYVRQIPPVHSGPDHLPRQMCVVTAALPLPRS